MIYDSILSPISMTLCWIHSTQPWSAGKFGSILSRGKIQHHSVLDRVREHPSTIATTWGCSRTDKAHHVSSLFTKAKNNIRSVHITRSTRNHRAWATFVQISMTSVLRSETTTHRRIRACGAIFRKNYVANWWCITRFHSNWIQDHDHWNWKKNHQKRGTKSLWLT